VLDDAVCEGFVITLNQGTYVSPQHSRLIRAIAENLQVQIGLSDCHWRIEML
jgi:hypothetical protein